jgi:outer membrane protein
VTRIIFLTIAFLFLMSLAGTTVLAQAPKIGYVNSTKILQEYPPAQDAQRKLDSLGKAWQSELDKMSRQLQQKYEEFQKKEALLSDQAKRDQREELVSLEQSGIQFRQQKFGNDGELAIATDSLLSPIKKRVMKMIEQIAKEEKIQFIFDRNEQILVLLYGDSNFDYTFRVIDRLKRGAK